METNRNTKKLRPSPLRGLPKRLAEITGYTKQGVSQSLKRPVPTTIMDIEVVQAAKEYAAKIGISYEQLFIKNEKQNLHGL